MALNAMLAADAWAGAAEDAVARRGGASGAERGTTAEFDDDARSIDTTAWFNR